MTRSFNIATIRFTLILLCSAALAPAVAQLKPAAAQQSASGPQSASSIRFEWKTLPFRLESSESQSRNAPETMAGGIAVFDYNGDGLPDIFFTNGADLSTLKKSSAKYSNRLFRNNGDGTFTDVTAEAGLTGTGFSVGVAAGDYDNDGHPDLFVAGVHGNVLYHNNGDGTFTDVTKKAGLDKWNDSEFGPLWAVAAAWVDVNNDGLLDLFVVNYLQWTYDTKPLCLVDNNIPEYCHPRFYKGVPNQLFLNQGDGTFKDVSKEWGIRDHVGKGMGVGVADFDLDGRQDLFVTNDSEYDFLFHNLGNKFEEVSFQTNTALPEEGSFISGMGLDFRDFNDDGYPDIIYVALNRQTFPVLQNTGNGDFKEVTSSSGMGKHSMSMAGFGDGLYDFDNDGKKDLFVSRGHVSATHPPGADVRQPNTVFRNLKDGKWQPLTEEAGFVPESAARHRGCAFGDFDGDGRVDIVVTSMDAPAELWMNRSPNSGHWLEFALQGVKSNRDGIGARIRVVSPNGVRYNHQTSSVCYASSSLGPVHFGLGPDTVATEVDIVWPSGIAQKLENVRADQIVKVAEPIPSPDEAKH
jgi:hypothetical protein